MSTDRTPDIDYGALHLAFDAAFQSFGAEHYSYDAAELAGIRAVVAAYVAQQRARGVVEVRADDLEWANDWYCCMSDWAQQQEGQAGKDVYDRNRAALTDTDSTP